MAVDSAFDRAKATEEIRRILFQYPELVDRGDIDGVVEHYMGVKRERDGELRDLSADEIREMYTCVLLYEDGLPHTKHLITNVDIWFSNENRTANTRSYFTVLQGFSDFPLQPITSGRYEDEYEFDGNEWRMTIRREHTDLLGDLSRHVTPETIQTIKDSMTAEKISY